MWDKVSTEEEEIKEFIDWGDEYMRTLDSYQSIIKNYGLF